MFKVRTFHYSGVKLFYLQSFQLSASMDQIEFLEDSMYTKKLYVEKTGQPLNSIRLIVQENRSACPD